MKNEFAYNLRHYRTQIGMSQDELAHRLGLKGKTSISHIESGRSDVSTEQLIKLSQILKCSPMDLLGTDANCTEFPIIGKVACGYGMLAVEDPTGSKINVPTEWLRNVSADEFFSLQISGDSMFPLYQDGDICLIRKSPELPPNNIALVLLEDETATLKEVRQGRGFVDLIPYNPEFQPRRVLNNRIRILGYVWTLIRQGF